MPDERVHQPQIISDAGGIPSGEVFGVPTLLERELYAISEAARLMQVPTATLRRWVSGGRGAGPIIEPNGVDPEVITWGQFVEAWLLRQYRERGAPLQRLRPLLDSLKRTYGVAYPLAHFQPWFDEAARELVFETQKTIKLPGSLLLVRAWGEGRGGINWQLQWTEAVRDWLEKVEFDREQDAAIRYRPLGEGTAVVIDPEVQFGIPQVRGFRTETLAEAFATGDSEDEIAGLWGLTVDEVKAAIRWELKTRDKAA